MESYLKNFLFDLLIGLILKNKCNETAKRLLNRYFELFDFYDEGETYFTDMAPEEVEEMEIRILSNIHQIIDRLD